MKSRSPWKWCWLLLLGALAVGLGQGAGRAADLKNRSISRSGQFVVYCDDREVRARVVGSVEQLKEDVLRILQETDNWDFPIIITIDPEEPGKPLEPVSVQLNTTLTGAKIDVAVRVGDDPARVFLHRHVLRAIFLEMAYRERPALKPGQAYAEPPWWLADGFFQTIRRREEGADANLFKSIVNTDKLPDLETFLARRPTLLDTPAGVVDRACAMCLVEALLAQPHGPQNMGRFIRQSPEAARDPAGALTAQFPSLENDPKALKKWWALQLGRFADGDRWQGLTLHDTDAQLAALLKLEVVIDKNGKTERYELGKFDQFIKLRGAPLAINAARVKIAAFASKANPLYRPILAEYDQICSLLSVKKTKGVAERIASIEQYRSTLLQRMGEITDYLNWYEATQAKGSAANFERYLKYAREAAAPKKLPPVDPRIRAYLNVLEKDFEPLFPNTIPGPAGGGAASR